MDAFHAGEQALQTQVGSRSQLAEFGQRVIRPAMPEQHQRFFAQLPFVLVAARDASGQPWASLLAGPPGFVDAGAADTLHIRARPGVGDPLHHAFVPGARIGVLGLEAHTRRRNRVNGRIVRNDADGLELRVEQSFGNCPKYIQPRRAEFQGGREAATPIQVSAGLGTEARRIIAQADTFFIASAYPASADDNDPAHGVDVSHRGGEPGFVRIEGNELTVPDLAGNNYFNTLGNLLLDARAGLLFVDFRTGDLAWIAAETEIIHSGPELAAFPAARRLLRLKVAESRFAPRAASLAWQEEVATGPS